MMFVKEIFSLEKKKLTEIIKLKRFNNAVYEKSYVRGTLSNFDRMYLLDNNSLIFNIKRNKHLKKKHVQQESHGQVAFGVKTYDSKSNRKIGFKHKGSSIYTTTFLYKNRKNNFLRFNLPSCTLSINKHVNIIDSYIEGIEKIIETKKVEETTLIFLFASKGGFVCLSSGFLGFMPKSEFRIVVLEWAKNFVNFLHRSNVSDLTNFLKLQKCQLSISPPPRFRFLLERMSTTIVLKRNRFLLSRKKRSNVVKNSNPLFIFYSINDSQVPLSLVCTEDSESVFTRISPQLYEEQHIIIKDSTVDEKRKKKRKTMHRKKSKKSIPEV